MYCLWYYYLYLVAHSRYILYLPTPTERYVANAPPAPRSLRDTNTPQQGAASPLLPFAWSVGLRALPWPSTIDLNHPLISRLSLPLNSSTDPLRSELCTPIITPSSAQQVARLPHSECSAPTWLLFGDLHGPDLTQ